MGKIIKLTSLFMTSALLFWTVCNTSTTNSIYTNTKAFTETNDGNSEEFIQPHFTYKVVTASGNLLEYKLPLKSCGSSYEAGLQVGRHCGLRISFGLIGSNLPLVFINYIFNIICVNNIIWLVVFIK